MAIRYEEVMPWGRNFDEYCRMFDLTDSELKFNILGCGDGPASFNAICNTMGGNVTSIDPIYHFTEDEIRKRIKETYADVIRQTKNNRHKFVWNSIKSVEDLGRIRMKAMETFLETYEDGRKRKQYIPGALPDLPFEDNAFDLALCSHFLFLYTDNLSFDFHVNAIKEMLRVSKETRIFPVLDANANKSDYLPGILEIFSGKMPEIRMVNYEFQIGGNEVLIIKNT